MSVKVQKLLFFCLQEHAIYRETLLWHDGAVKSFLHTNLKSHPCCVHLSSYYSPLALLLFALLFSCVSDSHKTSLDHVSPQMSRCLQCYSIHHYPQCLSMMFLLRYYSFYSNKVKSAVIQYDHDVKNALQVK